MCSTSDDWRAAAFASMATREWATVEAAVAAAIRGEAPLPGDQLANRLWEPEPRDFEHAALEEEASARVTWRLRLAYYGPAFSGFAWQPNAPKPTVEMCLQDAIRPLLDGRSELRLSCAGRTDAGVSSLGQLVSFHSSSRVSERSLFQAVARASPERDALRLVAARPAPAGYHATYSTAWRRYTYLLPALPRQPSAEVAADARTINALLKPLVGVAHDYSALGRSVPANKSTVVLLHHASAAVVEMPASGGGTDAAAIRIDLVGDRFIRQQVRTLVGTAVAAAAGGMELPIGGALDDDERLLAACTSGRQERTAHPAPAVGLVLMDAGTAEELEYKFRSSESSSPSAEEDGIHLDDFSLLSSTATLAGGGALADALLLLEQQRDCGAPLDRLLARHARAHGLTQEERVAISGHLDAVARHHGRLGLRLNAVGVEPTPRSRLIASVRLCSGLSELDDISATAAERAWFESLKPPLEAKRIEADDRSQLDLPSRLECPQWAWPSFLAAFGDGGAVRELRALQSGAPLDLRVNTLKTSRQEALAAIRSAGFAAEATPYSPVGLRLAERAVPLGQIPGLLEGLVEPQAAPRSPASLLCQVLLPLHCHFTATAATTA